ncbi:class I SAM-dependent methyltransferase [Mycobacterium sp. E1747]|uniref:class I SAM-dependent methyltransferase n=1 Tax=Mycobacterium sp. E1747 TaxID=1834128 RepID=UPI0007FE0CBA|nr:class I SAM-dependent methyltransferase [Mycobacterium sp. E1747]OBH09268.1 hypothetical protein A5695_01840 [Mycobacterium sp. E1747]
MTSQTTEPKFRWTARTLTFLFFWWIGGMRPGVVWHYLTDIIHYRLVKRGVLSGAAKHLAQVRAEFEEQAAKGQFQERWFDMNIVPWSVTFPKVFKRADPIRILEIGSWEGRSTLFFLTYFTQGHMTAVDTWAGSDEWHYHATSDLRDLEARFDHNVSSAAGRVVKRKGSSLSVLPQLIDEKQEFDLIYVDGSHFADDAIVDSLNSWRLLKQGGMMIFDDVMWPAYPRPRANTAWAIHQFLKYHAGEYKVLHAQYQIILQKKAAFDDRLADWVNHPAAAVAVTPSATNSHQPEQTHQHSVG